MRKKIAIIGTGYVGLTAGICLASLGHQVICVDKIKNKINNLKNGILPIYEPGLDQYLKKYKTNIEFTQNLPKAVSKSEIIFIAVGTPSKKDKSIDLSYIKQATKEIAKQLNAYKIIVNKSTVPVGTGNWTKKEIKKYYKGDFSVVSNPEFLREGSAIKDFLEPDRIVIGAEDKKAHEIMLDIYSKIHAPKIITDIKSAELIKYAANAFLATKISFINEIANICDRLDADVQKVAQGIGYDKRIGKYFLNAGIGYGGSCFPKDIDGLVSISNKHKYTFKLLNAVIEVNKNQQKIFIKKINSILKKIKGNTVCVWGLAFKANTDDVRKSPSIEIIKNLQRTGYKIRVYDPVATANAKKELLNKNITFCKNPYEAAKNADILALVTDWPEFSKMDMIKVKKIMHHPYLLDGRNQFEPEEMKKLGFYYEGIGRK